jgi:hypothetical protein
MAWAVGGQLDERPLAAWGQVQDCLAQRRMALGRQQLLLRGPGCPR